ncbi:flagellar hook-associated protein FlgK [Massilia sp. PAMC28688]|uniref:flagellar hook-associated protein FlgK n=1 Tax=Massilia sp. PAMC28688 TaxID=2861283 RepID=UPI001C637785|nr:flagellar hook-associated protein FlgK [Massilia sp. PAMC28688]QYF92018.1 flagellar hook-associated protein FlgK [Massilia sp. PAMC28688]
MAGNILNIGKSGLFAAQAGMSTTGHNIANANVAGYSRQLVLQGAGPGQNIGNGFIGSGTQVTDIKRYSDNFLNSQVRTATASKASLDGFYSQISQVDNLLSDTTSGLSPSLQDFFKGVQDVASNPSSAASRQALLSNADSLASRFQGLNGRLQEIREGVNSQITANVTQINSFADQIAQLNEQIGNASSAGQGMPNDLMDARDQLVLELNKQVKATVVAAGNNSITVSIGNGQPLVVGKKSFDLTTMSSPTDPTRVEVGYITGSKVVPLAESSLKGGELGGLFEFRSTSLDRAQNSLGRIAIGIAYSVNEQNRLGLDQDGNPGTNFFKEPQPFISASRDNNLTSTATVGATILDPGKLTQSDYKVGYDGSRYTITRLADSKQTVFVPDSNGKQSIDGLEFSISGLSAAGDNFLVRPTINGASAFGVALSDRSKIAAAAPITTNTPNSNAGSARISEGTVSKDYLASPLSAPVTLSYSAGTGGLSGFPPGQGVSVTANGVTTAYAAGTASIPFTEGATYTFGGASVSFTGAPADSDKFTVGPNVSGVGDNRNMRLIGNLQTRGSLDGGTATYQSAYAEMVSFVGNKTREVQVNAKAGDALLTQARNAQQSVSGVNLDEEASNLLRYQQAYQAAGKVMQMASTLFDTLLSLGR